MDTACVPRLDRRFRMKARPSFRIDPFRMDRALVERPGA
jgi:hypothetical protein